ncbi:MAG: hypothetical protein WBC55_01045, partial [Dehalococcoidia bacterium]
QSNKPSWAVAHQRTMEADVPHIVHGSTSSPRTFLRHACPEFIEELRANGSDSVILANDST